MKIITRGQKRDERIYDHQFICQDCGTVYQLVRGDPYKVDYDQRDGDAVVTKCPICGKQVWTDWRTVFA